MPRCLLLVLLNFLLAALFGSYPTALAHPPGNSYNGKKLSLSFPAAYSDSSSSVIPFNRAGNLIVVQARVDTTVGNFILDTGAPGLVLNITYFRDYPMSTVHDGEHSTIGGRTPTISKTSVKDLNFGNMQLHNLEADVTNLGNIENARGIRILGLLGLDLFKQCELIIDFEKSVIYLHRIHKKEGSAYQHELLNDTAAYSVFPIEISNQRMITTTEIAGKKLKLVIDCAAESNILDSRLPNKIFDQITITRRVKLTGPGDKKVDALYGNLNSMKMGSRQIENLPIIIFNLEYTCFANDICVNGVLGFDFLSQHKIGFNFVRRKMYIWK